MFLILALVGIAFLGWLFLWIILVVLTRNDPTTGDTVLLRHKAETLYQSGQISRDDFRALTMAIQAVVGREGADKSSECAGAAYLNGITLDGFDTFLAALPAGNIRRFWKAVGWEYVQNQARSALRKAGGRSRSE